MAAYSSGVSGNRSVEDEQMIPTENIDITRLAITLAAVAPFLALLLAAGVKDLKRRDMSETFIHWLYAAAFLALIVNTIEGFVFRIMNGFGLWPAIVATFWGIVFNVGAAFLLERLLRRLRRNRDAIRQSAVDILPALPLALGAVTALATIALIPPWRRLRYGLSTKKALRLASNPKASPRYS